MTTSVSAPFSLYQNCRKAVGWPVNVIRRNWRKQKKKRLVLNKFWKVKGEELENVKRRKADLQTINALRDATEQETVSADKNQHLSTFSKAAALLWLVKEKKKTHYRVLKLLRITLKKIYLYVLPYLLFFNSLDFCLHWTVLLLFVHIMNFKIFVFRIDFWMCT